MTKDPLTIALLAHIDRLSSISEDLSDSINSLVNRVHEKPRIAIIGRLKAGKSTLVNALLGLDIAETGILETTSLISVYQYGAPSRAIAHLTDGVEKDLELGRSEKFTLPVTPHDVSHVEYWLPTSGLANYSLIDTPGLATTTQTNQTTTERLLVEDFTASNGVPINADAAIFLFDSTPRQDEIDFVRSLGFTPLNTLGVLSRADTFGSGAFGDSDPLEEALKYSSDLTQRFSEFFLTVIPISGLLAEAARTGMTSEKITRELSRYRTFGLSEFLIELNATQTTISHGYDPTNESTTHITLFDLISIFGEYGVFHGREIASQGASELNTWLGIKSGIDDLELVMNTAVARFANIHRAVRVIESIDKLTFEFPEHRSKIREVYHEMSLDPRLYEVALLSSLKSLLLSNTNGTLIQLLIQILKGREVAEKLNLGRYATIAEKLSAIRNYRVLLEDIYSDHLDPAEEAAVVTLTRALSELENEINNPF